MLKSPNLIRWAGPASVLGAALLAGQIAFPSWLGRAKGPRTRNRSSDPLLY